MNFLEILVVLAVMVLMINMPDVMGVVVLVGIPVAIIVALIRVWRKYPSLWQMNRAARRAARGEGKGISTSDDEEMKK